MSCQLTVLSQFHDISSVRRFLFPSLKDATPEPRANDVLDTWTADWEWKEEDQQQESALALDEDENGRYNWLQDAVLSLSPANELLAIANEDRIVLLAQKWDPHGKDSGLESKFTADWQGSLRQEEGEVITAVLCLPLASQKRSTQGAPDWTCVIVGFSSGFVRMYTEAGTLLLSQLLHEEQVMKLKCRTYEAPRYLGMAEQHEELMILYKKTFVTIDGFSLFQSLRACRNQVARAAASGSDSFLQPPPLVYKKWGSQDQERLVDQVSCGVCSPNSFIQLRNTSMWKGFTSVVRISPPASSLYISTGSLPYAAFFYAEEGSTQPILSEVAYAVASKLKSALVSAASGWLGFALNQREDARERNKPPKIEPATALPLRFGLPDKRRHGESIVLSPNNKYAATTDSFGRVILIDVEKGVAVRMWKGYRDAQVGWVHVREEETQGSQMLSSMKMAQFLVIYAPRRGILEVWTALNGPRVAAFNVSKWCRLVTTSYGVMGLNNVTSRRVKMKAFQCALIDISGLIKMLEVPFHLALSDKSSKRARDLHLLKKLKVTLKENAEESDGLGTAVKEILLDMKIASIAQQGIERVLSTRYLSAKFMKSLIKSCIHQLNSRGEAKLDIDSRLFLQFCQAQDQLLHTYVMLEKLHSSHAIEEDSVDIEQIMMRRLLLTSSETDHILSHLDQFQALNEDEEVHVRFEEFLMPVTTFLTCFECPTYCVESDGAAGSHSSVVSLVKGLDNEKKLELSKLIFHRCLSGVASSGDLNMVLQDSSLPPDQLMDLLMQYWMSVDDRSVDLLENVYCIVKAITAMTDTSEVMVNHDSLSPWWETVRGACSHSTNCRAAYIFALTARAVAMEIMISQSKAKDPDADTADTASVNSDKMDLSDWEDVSVDIEKWNCLLQQLEDVLALSCLLKMKHPKEKNDMSSIASSESITVSVSKLLDGGRGSVPEIVAKFITRNNLPITTFNYHQQRSSDIIETGEEPSEVLQVKMAEKIKGQIDVLQVRFLHSLNNDVLLSNCCWEYAVLWNKDPEDFQNLRFSLEYMKLVENAVLRQGIGSMLWHMFALKRLSATANLMEKVGKAPKDRLCRKEVGMSDSALCMFIQMTCELLQIIMEANCEANEVPVFNMELLWQQIGGPASLVELAVDQKATNYGLLMHHLHLFFTMHIILVFGMRSVKILSLFDSKGRNSFFKDLHSHPLLPRSPVELAITLERRKFLNRSTSLAVEALSNANKESDENSNTSAPVDSKKIASILSVILELGKEFGLDVDQLKRHHVVELYSRGMDKMAEEVLLTVNDHELMSSDLLLIAGQRLAYFIDRQIPSKILEIMVTTTTTVSTWLKTMDHSQLACPEVPLRSTGALIGHAISQLPEGYSEYNLAVSLIELIDNIHCESSTESVV